MSWVVNTKGVKCCRAAECSTQAYESFQSQVRRIYYLCQDQTTETSKILTLEKFSKAIPQVPGNSISMVRLYGIEVLNTYVNDQKCGMVG